jgi:YD repeat-containing protein
VTPPCHGLGLTALDELMHLSHKLAQHPQAWGYLQQLGQVPLVRGRQPLPPLNHTTTFAYDAAGNRTQLTDPLGRTTSYAYDALNRLKMVTQPDPDGGGPLGTPVTTRSYDLAGRLKSLTDAVNNLTTYNYDDAGRLWTVTDPRLRCCRSIVSFGASMQLIRPLNGMNTVLDC